MSIPAVTPVPGEVSEVASGGTAVIVFAGGPNGGIITNPYTATDQGISNTEPLYVDPVGSATTNGNGTTFALQPGQSWTAIPGQTTQTSVNAATGGHKFAAISW